MQISERTIRGWESGATRIPYAAFKLMRVLKGGRLLEHPNWQHFHVRGSTLWTPEGHALEAGDLAWLSLLVRRARAFGELLAIDRTTRPGQAQAAAAAAPTAPASRPAGQQEEGASDAPGSSAAAGLVYSSTSGTLGRPETASTAENKGSAAHVVEARHAPGPRPGLRPRRDPAGGSTKQRLAAALRASGGDA